MERSAAVEAVISGVSAAAETYDGEAGTKTEPPKVYIERLVDLAVKGHGGVPEALLLGKARYLETRAGTRIWTHGGSVPNPDDDAVARQQWDRAVKIALTDIAGLLDDAKLAAMFADMSTVQIESAFRMPDIGRRTDGSGLFYRGAVNMIYGPPEEGKTLIATAIATQELNAGRTVLWIDLDNNGKRATKARMLAFGAATEQINDVERFLYSEPTTKNEIRDLVFWSVFNKPDLVVCDSLGKLMAAMGIRSDGDGEYADMHTKTLANMAAAGCGVLVLDHTTKSDRDDGYSIGTQRKKSDIDGTMLRVKKIVTFVPSVGGSASMVIQKDRPGGLRANTPMGVGNRKQVAATFTVGPDSLDWCFDAGSTAVIQDAFAKSAADIETLQTMSPPPASVNDVKARLGWGTTRASAALKALRAMEPTP